MFLKFLFDRIVAFLGLFFFVAFTANSDYLD